MTILDQIVAGKRAELPALEARRPLAEVKSAALDAPPARGFAEALRTADVPVALIAEVKRASPSQGVIRPDFDPVAIARSYEEAGAQCLSVLTDQGHFQGAPEHLIACRAATRLPVLRKDFTVAEYHVWEARAMGADAVLLIANCLDRAELKGFRELAESLGMDALVEVHSLAEARAAVESEATLVGVNNRDLHTFKVSLDVACEVIPQLKGFATVVSESALRTNQDIQTVAAAGARAVLIGTAFCRAPDPGTELKEVMGW